MQRNRVRSGRPDTPDGGDPTTSDVDRTEGRGPGIGYVLTDYPRLAMTFITGEVDEVERRRHRVVPIAMNLPSRGDVATTEGRRRRQATLYLKGRGAVALVATFARLVRRRPLETIQLIGRAVRSGGTDVDLIARRLVHLVYAATVVEHCRREDVRHLHAHFGQSPATIAWFAAEIGNWDDPGRWTWSFTIHGFQDFVDEAIARLDLKAASAAFVVCVSDFTRSQLCRVTDPQLWDRFEVVRCGIDLDEFPRRAERRRSSPPVVTTVARLSPEKGHGTLFEAVRLLRDKHGTTVSVEVIGDGPSGESLRALAAELEVDGAVDFVGELAPDEVAARLRESDVFCLPSFSEGLPISIMEAMAIGVPVVATHIAGIPELAIHRETALTVAPGNASELADALHAMLTDPDLARRLAAAGRRAVEDRHQRSVNVDELLALVDRHASVDPGSRPLPSGGRP